MVSFGMLADGRFTMWQMVVLHAMLLIRKAENKKEKVDSSATLSLVVYMYYYRL